MKKIFAIVMAMIMMLSMATAFAAADGTITLTGTTATKVYEVYRIFDVAKEGDTLTYTINANWAAFFTGAGAGYIVDENNEAATLAPITVNGEAKFINLTDGNVEEFAQAALPYAKTLAADYSVTAAGTTATISNVEYGYYLMYPVGAADKTAGSICSLSNAAPNAQISIKATYPTINKTVEDALVEFGQAVEYTITGKVPDTTGYESYTYKVTDTMSDGLTFAEATANFKVTIDGTEIDVDPTYANNGFVLTLDMCDYQQYVGKEIVITYEAIVNENAVAGEAETNEAKLEYQNDDEIVESPQKPIVKVYTCSVTVDKYGNGNEDNKLAGATFVLKNSAGKFYKLENGVVSWVDTQGEATPKTTEATGLATFDGLQAGTYYLVETQAPTGYNLLTGETQVTVDNDDETEALAAATAKVNNNYGTELPSTGGIGTTIFYVVGGLLMAAAVVLLVTNKKMSAAK